MGYSSGTGVKIWATNHTTFSPTKQPLETKKLLILTLKKKNKIGSTGVKNVHKKKKRLNSEEGYLWVISCYIASKDDPHKQAKTNKR